MTCFSLDNGPLIKVYSYPSANSLASGVWIKPMTIEFGALSQQEDRARGSGEAS